MGYLPPKPAWGKNIHQSHSRGFPFPGPPAGEVWASCLFPSPTCKKAKSSLPQTYPGLSNKIVSLGEFQSAWLLGAYGFQVNKPSALASGQKRRGSFLETAWILSGLQAGFRPVVNPVKGAPITTQMATGFPLKSYSLKVYWWVPTNSSLWEVQKQDMKGPLVNLPLKAASETLNVFTLV